MQQQEAMMRDLLKRYRFGSRGQQPNAPDRSSFTATRPMARPQGGLQLEDVAELDFGQLVRQVPPQTEEGNPWGRALGNIGGALAGKTASLLKGDEEEGVEITETEESPVKKAGRGVQEWLQGGQLPVDEVSIIGEETTEPTLAREPRASDALWAEIQRRTGKDLKKGGKDADTTHNFKDVLRSFGLGALQSLANADPRQGTASMLGSALGGGIAGGVGGAIDPNTDEKIGNEIALASLTPKYQQQYGLEQQRDVDELNRQKSQAAIDELTMRPVLRRKEIERKALADQRRNEMAQMTLDWKKEDRDRFYELEEQKQAARERKDETAVRQFERKQAEIERANRAREKQNADNEAGRNQRAGLAEAGRNQRQQIAIQAQAKAAELRAAQQSGRMERAAELRKELEELKRQYDNQ
ncbi:hypothetical protein [Geitlerinema calcuttense]|uniref:Uncharacterized protein n=1 Tax=Geitlerinema calcuttense NRMC-F 0142 TaxID=2922238 RepID=A0ABT7LV38_9CYAN|nr:hypothetical protein [Geitlerinema calcuttense]MDL5055902.1 hypothetical protein [Geitlerinema calcuttense NRMC-F 0142]